MSFVIIVIGAVMIAAGIRNKESDFFSLLHDDLTGQNNFIYWAMSILIIGALGYISTLQTFSRYLLALVLIVLLLSNGTFFSKLNQKTAVQG